MGKMWARCGKGCGHDVGKERWVRHGQGDVGGEMWATHISPTSDIYLPTSDIYLPTSDIYLPTSHPHLQEMW